MIRWWFMHLKHYRRWKILLCIVHFFHYFNMIHTGFSCRRTYLKPLMILFFILLLFTWNAAGASIASSSLKVMVKGQKCKDKDKTPLLQGSIQFSLIRQSCHWNQWQLCLNKKGWIGISVVWVCNLTICPTW